MKLTFAEWLSEREANARQIAASKHGIDKAGWMEDAEYFKQAAALAARPVTPAPECLHGVVGECQCCQDVIAAGVRIGLYPASVSKQPSTPDAPIAWWNGIRKTGDGFRDMDQPSFAEQEGPNHDIPVFSGCNPHSNEARLSRAARIVAGQAGEDSAKFIDWLCDGGFVQMALSHFGRPASAPEALSEANDEEIEGVIACLGDDAAELHNVNPTCEVADNMLRAAELLEILRTLRAALAAPSTPAAEREPWLLYLSDRADGVKGHFAIARWNPKGYREVWNLRSHQWAAFSEEVLTLDEANALLQSATLAATQAQYSAPETLRSRLDELRTIGHGHVLPRADGFKARCGGPRFCPVCRFEESLTLAPSQPAAASTPEQIAQREEINGREGTDEPEALSDEQIEAQFKACGGRWSGDAWVMEDADLHPFVRSILAAPSTPAATQAQASELPELPGHPDPHAWTWTEAEKRVIREWGESILNSRAPSTPAAEPVNFAHDDLDGQLAEIQRRRDAATQAQASETFEAFWATLPIPGEYDAMDPIDQRRWRDVVRLAFDHIAGTDKMVAADLVKEKS